MGLKIPFSHESFLGRRTNRWRIWLSCLILMLVWIYLYVTMYHKKQNQNRAVSIATCSPLTPSALCHLQVHLFPWFLVIPTSVFSLPLSLSLIDSSSLFDKNKEALIKIWRDFDNFPWKRENLCRFEQREGKRRTLGVLALMGLW